MRTSSYAVLPAVLVLALLLLGCGQSDRFPRTASESVADLKSACNAACAGQTTATVFVPGDSFLYATNDAVCIRASVGGNARLTCGTCSCQTYGPEAKALVRTIAPTNVTCTFTGDGVSVVGVSCS